MVNTCQPGNKLLASGYCMYSSSIIFVITIGNGVFGFTLDQSVGEFMLSHNDIKVIHNTVNAAAVALLPPSLMNNVLHILQ